MRIDSHQHFWNYDPVKDSWINNEMEVIKRDFAPSDVLPLLQQSNFDGCIAVQADQSERETRYLLKLAEEYDFIKGVVGWVDMRADDIEERLGHFSQFKKLKGFRHIVQSEPQIDYLLRKDFCKGISYLKSYDFTYDILIYPKHLKYAQRFVEQFDDQTFVLDHLAKPLIRDQSIKDWHKDILPFKDFKNVSCKMAGLVTEADWGNWKVEDFQKYVDVILEVFGPDRMMFGSDWPVCTLAGSFRQVVDLFEQCTSFLSSEDRDKLWGGNCVKVYGLNS